jgi:hypothetical protein
MKYLLKTAESAVKQDKNGRNYKTVTFTEAVIMNTPFGQVQKPTSQCRSTSINCYESSYLNDKPEVGYHDPIFNPRNPSNGGLFEGAIETRNVTPYDITDRNGDVREVSSYTTVIFGDTQSPAYETSVAAAFRSKGHEAIVPVATTITAEELEAEAKPF